MSLLIWLDWKSPWKLFSWTESVSKFAGNLGIFSNWLLLSWIWSNLVNLVSLGNPSNVNLKWQFVNNRIDVEWDTTVIELSRLSLHILILTRLSEYNSKQSRTVFQHTVSAIFRIYCLIYVTSYESAVNNLSTWKLDRNSYRLVWTKSCSRFLHRRKVFELILSMSFVLKSIIWIFDGNSNWIFWILFLAR